MHASWVKLTPEQRAELNENYGSSGWRVITREQIPNAFPYSLREKVESALEITADTSTGGTYYIISAWRLDRKDLTFDNEPFGLIVHADGASEDAVLIHHGEWSGRTQPIPDYLLETLDKDGVCDYLWAVPPTDKNYGELLELLPLVHRSAFNFIVREIRTKIDVQKNGSMPSNAETD